MKRKHGFTLIEMIVVIAIIGILSAILIPTITGYVKKARLNADIDSAKSIGMDVTTCLLNEEGYTASFLKYLRTAFTVTTTTKNGSETYQMAVICKIDGQPGTGIPGGLKCEWNGDIQSKDFVDALNTFEGLTGSTSVKKVMQSKTFGDDDKTINRWLVCVRTDDTTKIEIWAGNRLGTWACGPVARLWPDACTECATVSP